jgi:hypothetical protein
MWIVIRLLLALFGFLMRQWRRRRALGKARGAHEGEPYFVHEVKDKSSVKSISIGMALAAPTWIRMHRESRFDRFCKRLGVANERETGAADFDDQVYVTCDHLGVSTILAREAKLRAAILAAMGLRGAGEGDSVGEDDSLIEPAPPGAKQISYDGTAVWMEDIAASEATPEILSRMAALHAASAPIGDTKRQGRFSDPFLWKALIVEGLVWGIAGYAAGAVLGNIVHPEDLHVWPSQLVWAGLGVALGALILLIALLVLWLRGSSRGHVVLAESAVVLTLGLPLASIQLVADTNRALDEAPAQTVVVHAHSCESKKRLLGRRSYYYAISIARTEAELAASDVELPSTVDVAREVCSGVAPSTDRLELEIGPGRWGLPWYRRMKVGGVDWEAPR